MSDAAGLGLGHTVLGMGTIAAGAIRGAATTAQARDAPTGAILGAAVGIVGSALAATEVSAKTITRESGAAFHEGADARIEAYRASQTNPKQEVALPAAITDNPVNAGDQQAHSDRRDV